MLLGAAKITQMLKSRHDTQTKCAFKQHIYFILVSGQGIEVLKNDTKKGSKKMGDFPMYTTYLLENLCVSI